MMGLDNPMHIAFLLVLLLLVFGAKRLPEMGRSLGAGLRGFKDSLTDEPTALHAEPPRLAAAPEMAAMAPVATTAPVAAMAPVATAPAVEPAHATPVQPAAHA
jgi:sec-independent protein translocase protein TatA